MKKNQFFILILILFCSCNYIFEHAYGVRVVNRSSLKQIACILKLDYSINDQVSEGDMFSIGTTQVCFRRDDPRDWRMFLPDSVCIYIIDPSFFNDNFFEEITADTPITVNVARRINDNPECIVAKYYLSEEQFIEGYGNKFFPPNESMKETVRMWPSYDEIISKYGN